MSTPTAASPPAPDTRDGSPGLAANLIAQMVHGMLAMTLCLPSMQEWGAIFKAGPATVQLTLSSFLLGFGALQLLYGPLSDRHGRRRMLLIGLAVGFVGALLGLMATSIEAVIAARFVQGAGLAAGMVVGRASVQDLFEGPQRTRMMAYVGMVMGLCPPLGTVIGGQMHVRFGWASNFVLMAVLAAALWLAAFAWLPRRGPETAKAQPAHWLRAMGQAYARLAREPVFLLNVMILACSAATFYAFLGSAPLLLKAYGIGPDQVGWFIMLTPLSYIVGNFMASRIALRRDAHWQRRAGLLITATGIVTMVLLALAGVRSPFAFSLPLMLLGFGHGLFTPLVLAATVGVVPALAGAAAAVAGVMQQLIGAIGGWGVGWVSLATPVPAGLLMLGFTGVALACQAALQRR